MKISELITIIPDDSYRRGSFLHMTESEYNNRLLYEGLISSVSRTNVITILKKILPTVKIIIQRYDFLDLSIQLRWPVQATQQLHDEITHALDRVGWYCSSILVNGQKVQGSLQYDNLSPTSIITYFLEPKYDVQIIDLPTKLYHITTINHLDKIKKIGLVPKNQNKLSTHPARVYAALTKSAAEEIMQLFADADASQEHIMLEINPHNLIRNTKWYWDMNFMDNGKPLGIYTLSNIPPMAITVVQQEI